MDAADGSDIPPLTTGVARRHKVPPVFAALHVGIKRTTSSISAEFQLLLCITVQ